jgi:hypothetical protein
MLCWGILGVVSLDRSNCLRTRLGNHSYQWHLRLHDTRGFRRHPGFRDLRLSLEGAPLLEGVPPLKCEAFQLVHIEECVVLIGAILQASNVETQFKA